MSIVEDQPLVTIFYDGEEESQRALQLLREKGERFLHYDVRNLKMPETDRMYAPTLFAPEGVFLGLRLINFFLSIPSDHRWSNIGQVSS